MLGNPYGTEHLDPFVGGNILVRFDLIEAVVLDIEHLPRGSIALQTLVTEFREVQRMVRAKYEREAERYVALVAADQDEEADDV